jgi:hypothetical protein
MATLCIICDCEFELPINKKKKENLFHSTDQETKTDLFMCEDCFDERSNADYRYVDGQMLCANMGCARNAVVMSKYCEICANK